MRRIIIATLFASAIVALDLFAAPAFAGEDYIIFCRPLLGG
jgi:hypothetical protein